jgi:hypothetical protein
LLLLLCSCLLLYLGLPALLLLLIWGQPRVRKYILSCAACSCMVSSCETAALGQLLLLLLLRFCHRLFLCSIPLC